MITNDDLDRRLTEALSDLAQPRDPDYKNEALAATRHVRQRPAWAFLERWLPMTLVQWRGAAAPPLRLAFVLLLLGLLAALAVAGALIGSALLNATTGGMDEKVVMAFDSDGDIYTMRVDGTDVRRLTATPAFDSAAHWSPDGTRIAFLSFLDGEQAPSLMVMDAGGRDVVTVSRDVPVRDDGRSFSWAPDGESIVFAEDDTSTPPEIYIAATDGSGLHRLETGTWGASHPSWSPDGSWIAFRGQVFDCCNQKTGVYVVAPDGSGARQVSAPAPDDREAWSWPVWSHDSSQLAFVMGGPNGHHDIATASVDGVSQRIVSDDVADEWDPSWAPDANRLTFKRLVRGVGNDTWWDTYLWDSADGSIERVDLPTSYGSPATWLPDGDRLIIEGPPMEGDAEGLGHLLVATLDGSSATVSIGVMWSSGRVSFQPVPAPLPEPPSFPAESPPA